MSEIIQEAFEDQEAIEEKVRGHRPKPLSLGVGASGRTNLSVRAGDEEFDPEPWR